MIKNYYDNCYDTRKRIGVVLNKSGTCKGLPEDIRTLTLSRDCLECPYLDPLRKAMWNPENFVFDKEGLKDG